MSHALSKNSADRLSPSAKTSLNLPKENQPEAESFFRQALEVARRQRAKSLELRASVSLGRLWRHQGKRHESRALLTEIYSWFSEGFDTADLKEAKALLENLGERAGRRRVISGHPGVFDQGLKGCPFPAGDG